MTDPHGIGGLDQPLDTQDDALPSGRWVGFYTHSGSQVRHRMDLDLTFKNGRVMGDGGDDIGPFRISGVTHQDRSVTWTKTYIGRHQVWYSGYAELKGIWGTWQIGRNDTGGFRIWPAASGLGDGLVIEEEIPSETDFVEAAPAVVQR